MKNNTPLLKVAEPIVSKLVLGFGIFNLLLGAGLFSLTARTLNFFIINDVFNEKFWGSLFFIIGLVFLVSYIVNSWSVMRFMLVFGFTLKVFWLLALGVRQLEELNTNVFLLLFFTFVAFTQFVVYLHFPDKIEVEKWTHNS